MLWIENTQKHEKNMLTPKKKDVHCVALKLRYVYRKKINSTEEMLSNIGIILFKKNYYISIKI